MINFSNRREQKSPANTNQVFLHSQKTRSQGSRKFNYGENFSSLTFQQPLNKVVNVYFTLCHFCFLYLNFLSQITLFCFTSLLLFLVKIHDRIFFLGCFFSLPKFYLGRTYTHTRRKRQILLFSQFSPPARFEQPPPSQSSKEMTVLPNEVYEKSPKSQERANKYSKPPNICN